MIYKHEGKKIENKTNMHYVCSIFARLAIKQFATPVLLQNVLNTTLTGWDRENLHVHFAKICTDLTFRQDFLAIKI